MLRWRDAIVVVAMIVAVEKGVAGDGVRRVALTDLAALEVRATAAEVVGTGEGVRPLEAVECIDAPAGR